MISVLPQGECPPELNGKGQHENGVFSTLWFLKEAELYRTVKPYRLRFASPNPDVPRSNVICEEAVNVPIYDLRKVKPMEFDHVGFQTMELESQLSYNDCKDRAKVEQLFLKDLKQLLCGFFHTPHVILLDHTPRRRHPQFPISHGSDYTSNQPVMVAHVDWTLDEINAKILEAVGKERTDRIRSGRYQYVHIWKPFNGPLKDWPIAYCDASTVDPSKDLEKGDYVNDDADYNSEETYQVYYRQHYRWYYLSDQKTNEVVVFRQYDSKYGDGSGVPHIAFKDPTATGEEPPRESIEVQAIIYYDIE